MHEADDAYSIWNTWACYWLDQFLTLALDAWILSKFSTLYWICLLLVFLVLVGVELPLCDHSILECYYLFSGVELSMRSFFVIIIKLELMTDIDMFQFIEKGMCGGVSYIANRYGNDNNKYMKEYDEKAPSKYIMYLDANNLYGWAMSQHLPTGNFKWMTDKEISKIDLGKYKADGNQGMILEVDLEYPQELHDIHNDYPVAPEKVKVSNKMLSAY